MTYTIIIICINCAKPLLTRLSVTPSLSVRASLLFMRITVGGGAP